MSVVLVMRAKAAAAVRSRLDGNVYEHCRGRFASVPDSKLAEEGPAQIVRLVEKTKPLAVVVDITLGGQRYMTMAAVRSILGTENEQGNQDRPAVVLVVPRLTIPLARHAWELGVYSAVETTGRSAVAQAQTVADEVCRAIAWKDGLSAQRLPWLSDLESSLKPSTSASRPRVRRRAV